MDRNIFEKDHNMFRDTVRKFVEKEIAPFHAEWEKAGIVPRELWEKAGFSSLEPAFFFVFDAPFPPRLTAIFPTLCNYYVTGGLLCIFPPRGMEQTEQTDQDKLITYKATRPAVA